MSIEDSGAPAEPKPLPPPQPQPTRRSRARPFGIIIVAAVIAVAALAGLSAIADYALRDRTASSPAAPTVTLTASSKAPALADGADGLFLSTLASYNIPSNGGDATRQRFMEFGHHACYSLLPPRPQPFDKTVRDLFTAANQDAAKGDPWAPRLSYDDAENLVHSAIKAYCPNAPQ
jgi:Protein of unknown function (DUF732)